MTKSSEINRRLPTSMNKCHSNIDLTAFILLLCKNSLNSLKINLCDIYILNKLHIKYEFSSIWKLLEVTLKELILC